MKSINVKMSHSRGYSLVELVIAMSTTTVLLAGLGSAVIVSARSFRPESMVSYSQSSATAVEQDLMSDLRLATGFTERTNKSTTFSVPDRDGDGRPETLRYAWSGQFGDPLTFSFNAAQAIPIALDVRSFSLSYTTQAIAGVALPSEQDGSKIVLLVNDSTSLTSREAIRKAMFESWNFVVVTLGLNDDTQSVVAESQEADAIYVSSALNAVKAETIISALKTSRTGVVNEHREFVDDFGFASETDTSSFTTNLNLTNNTHYVSSTSNSGSQSLGSQNRQFWLKGTLAANLNTLGTVSSNPGLVTVDPDELLYDGGRAAGRRVVLPWGVDNADPTRWNSLCQTLTCRAIEWATGLGEESPDLKFFGFNTVFSSQNGTSNIQYSTLATLPENGKLKSISAYVGGAVDQVRFAIYRDNKGQPDQLVVQSAVGNTTTSLAWVTLTVPDTNLTAGNYWLAFSFRNSSQKYRFNSTGTGERNKSNAAVANGFSSTWGTSSSSFNGSRSIYATYEVP